MIPSFFISWPAWHWKHTGRSAWLPALVLLGLPVRFSSQEARSKVPQNPPRNIILMIGDGMGLTQITAGLYTSPSGGLFLEEFPVTGLMRTHSSNRLVTDGSRRYGFFVWLQNL